MRSADDVNNHCISTPFVLELNNERRRSTLLVFKRCTHPEVRSNPGRIHHDRSYNNKKSCLGDQARWIQRPTPSENLLRSAESQQSDENKTALVKRGRSITITFICTMTVHGRLACPPACLSACPVPACAHDLHVRMYVRDPQSECKHLDCKPVTLL